MQTLREVALFGHLLCAFGGHAWERRVNPEVGGKDAVYSVCRRCAKEKAGYGTPTSSQATGLAGGVGGG